MEAASPWQDRGKVPKAQEVEKNPNPKTHNNTNYTALEPYNLKQTEALKALTPTALLRDGPSSHLPCTDFRSPRGSAP